MLLDILSLRLVTINEGTYVVQGVPCDIDLAHLLTSRD
jgi:hypothetical protein